MPTYTMKTVSGTAFTVELAASQTVLDLKKSIQASQGHEAASIKLIQTGKILSDDSATLEAAGVKDSSSGQFVVVMVSKAKAAVPATAAPSATGAAAPPPVPPPASSAAAPPAAPAPPAAAAPTQQQQQQQPQGNPFEGPDFTSHIELLKGMGLTTDESILKNALIAAFNNPDRAVEYLLGGIPEGALARGLAHGKQQQGGGGAGAGAGGGKSSGGGSAGAPAPRTYPAGAHPATLEGGALFALRNHPQLTAIRTAIKTSPSNIPMAINAIAQVMPELASAIEANKDAFLQLMNEPEPVAGEVAGGGEMELGEEGEEEGDDMDEAAMLGGQNPAALMAMIAALPPAQQAAAAAQMGIPVESLQAFLGMMASQMGAGSGFGGGMGGGQAPGGHQGGAPAGTVSVELTTDEAAAVERLVGMGFPKNKVLEAFILCDRNEEMAANMLLNDMDG